MAMNRLTRDQILTAALNQVDSPTLDNKERPDGSTIAGTLGAEYLQEALDLFHKRFPLSADLKTSTLTLAKDSTTVALPSDLILDVRDWVVLASDEGRLYRRSLSKLLSMATLTRDKPTRYCVRGSTLEYRPSPNKDYTATLWYYGLPAVLGAATVPQFPDDYVLVKYVQLAYTEWLKLLPEGSAMVYANQVTQDLLKSGIGNEAEEDQIPVDRESFGERTVSRTDWMGNPTL